MAHPSPATQPHGISSLAAGDPAGGCPTPGRGLSPQAAPCLPPASPRSAAPNAVPRSPWAGGAQPPARLDFLLFSAHSGPTTRCRSPHPPVNPCLHRAFTLRSWWCRASGGQCPAPCQTRHPKVGMGAIFPQDHPLLPLRATAHRKAKNLNK